MRSWRQADRGKRQLVVKFNQGNRQREAKGRFKQNEKASQRATRVRGKVQKGNKCTVTASKKQSAQSK